MARKHNATGRSRRKLSPFIALERYMLNSLGWRSLDPVSRAVYVELAQAHDGSNNGRIVMSVRMLANRLGVSKDTAAAKLRTLEAAGLIEIGSRRGLA
jgi:DNA-binding MarR family transcriptional regulator